MEAPCKTKFCGGAKDVEKARKVLTSNISTDIRTTQASDFQSPNKKRKVVSADAITVDAETNDNWETDSVMWLSLSNIILTEQDVLL